MKPSIYIVLLITLVSSTFIFAQQEEKDFVHTRNVRKIDSVPLYVKYDKTYRNELRHKLFEHDFDTYFYENFDTSVLKEIIQFIDTTKKQRISFNFTLNSDLKTDNISVGSDFIGKNLAKSNLKYVTYLGGNDTLIMNNEIIKKEVTRLINDYAVFKTPGYHEGAKVNTKFSGVFLMFKIVKKHEGGNASYKLVRENRKSVREKLIASINSKPFIGYGVDYANFESMDSPPLYNQCTTKTSLEERRKCTNDKVIRFIENNLDMDYINKTVTKDRFWDTHILFRVLADGKIVDINSTVRGAPLSMRTELFRVMKIIPDFDTAGTHKGRKAVTIFRLNLKIKTLPQD